MRRAVVKYLLQNLIGENVKTKTSAYDIDIVGSHRGNEIAERSQWCSGIRILDLDYVASNKMNGCPLSSEFGRFDYLRSTGAK